MRLKSTSIYAKSKKWDFFKAFLYWKLGPLYTFVINLKFTFYISIPTK